MSTSDENSDRFFFFFSKKSQYSVQTMLVWTIYSCEPRRRVSCLGRLIAPHPPSPYDFHCFVNADWKIKQTFFGSFAFLSILLSFMNKIITMHVHVTLIREWENLYRTFHSRGQHLCQFIGTKRKRVYIRKEFNSYKIGLEHRHGCRFIVLEHQQGPYDPTTATPMKKSLKNRIRVFWNF